MPAPTTQQLARLQFGNITKKISKAKQFHRKFKELGNTEKASEAKKAVDMFYSHRDKLVKQMQNK